MNSLIAIDIGNSHTVIGYYREDNLLHNWRIPSDANETPDELRIILHSLFSVDHIELDQGFEAIISSVVPILTGAWRKALQIELKKDAHLVSSSLNLGIDYQYENPQEIGADRVVNAVAALEKYKNDLIIVDFGTATTFDAVSGEGAYLGGAIVPGVEISSQALFDKAAKLSRVDLKFPPAVIGKNTAESLCSGILFGTTILVDGMIEAFSRQLGSKATTVATGGLADTIAPFCHRIDHIDLELTLFGLNHIFKKCFARL